MLLAPPSRADGEAAVLRRYLLPDDYSAARFARALVLPSEEDRVVAAYGADGWELPRALHLSGRVVVTDAGPRFAKACLRRVRVPPERVKWAEGDRLPEAMR
jgi:hypothetical protein